MSLTGNFRFIPLEDISIQRPDRQRSEPSKIEELADSIKRLGLINPIVVTRDNVLVAGERRFLAHQLLSKTEEKFTVIAAQFVDELDTFELQAIELEENIKRDDLPWKDAVAAIAKYHKMRVARDPDWTHTATANSIGLQQNYVSKVIAVYDAILEGDKHVLEATSIFSAYQIVSRKTQRAVDTELSNLFETELSEEIAEEEVEIEETVGEISIEALKSPSPRKSSVVVRPAEKDIVVDSFLEWAKTYSGKKFNFIHCDFPYGIDMQDSEQARSVQWGSYEDAEKVYWDLCKVFCTRRDVFMSQSCHIFFWFSMKFYQETLDFFTEHAPEIIIEPFPCIWMKSDGKGILPDPKRGPRRIYETAFIMRRADRQIIRAVNNAYPAPTKKTLHLSEKPEPVLRHFFQMFVDGLSEVFDPTCGSGGALRAAESLGAKRVFGMDIDQGHVNTARTELQRARVLAAASKMGEGK